MLRREGLFWWFNLIFVWWWRGLRDFFHCFIIMRWCLLSLINFWRLSCIISKCRLNLLYCVNLIYNFHCMILKQLLFASRSHNNLRFNILHPILLLAPHPHYVLIVCINDLIILTLMHLLLYIFTEIAFFIPRWHLLSSASSRDPTFVKVIVGEAISLRWWDEKDFAGRCSNHTSPCDLLGFSCSWSYNVWKDRMPSS